MRRKARECALQILYALDLNPQPVREFFRVYWDLNPSKEEVREYTSNLVEGTLKKRKEIDLLISTHSSHWKIDRMPVTDRNILRLATYEMIQETSVPHKVIINEAIEIAKKFGTTDSSIFINGVLDSIHQNLIASERIPEQVK